MIVNERFQLSFVFCDSLHRMTPKFGYNGFGELVYYRTYSRVKQDGTQEQWADTVIRVIEGIMSIRMDHYVKNHIAWDAIKWQQFAQEMALALFRMEWMPSGRGLWAMGTNLVYNRGAMALYNCAYTDIGIDWIEDLCWAMDSLMHGCGVGAGPQRIPLNLSRPDFKYEYMIPDSREGWVESVRFLLNAFTDPDAGLPLFDYSLIRDEGEPIKTFGGTCSGPEPLKALHERIIECCIRYIDDEDYDIIEFFADLMNHIGVCVVTGNVRRSAEILVGKLNDPTFVELKNYDLKPERASHGWMSNNSVLLETDEDFEEMPEIAARIRTNGEPGYLNLRNMPKGRIGDTHYPLRRDRARGLNPCGEIPLEHREVCNVAETCPTRCATSAEWLAACQYATFYCSTVALLPTHQPSTNAVVLRNRRIGVSIIDFTGWKKQVGVSGITKYLRDGYNYVREINKQLANEAGVPESLRVTTIKPGGTVPKLVGRTSGAGYPNFQYMIRRIRVQQNTPFEQLLKDAGIPWEPDHYSKQTTCFEYPTMASGDEFAEDISLWEQAFNLILLQREWADNAVSNTLNFKPKWVLNRVYQLDEIGGKLLNHDERCKQEGGVVKIYKKNQKHEEDQIEAVLSAIAPHTKSVTMLPHTAKGVYVQMPEEGITREQYEQRVNEIQEIDWSNYRGDGENELYCSGDTCVKQT